MILSFTRVNGENYVAWNNERPMVQAAGSCQSMFESAERADGLSFADEMIPGWLASADCPRGGYWNAKLGSFGTLYSGHVEAIVTDSIGWRNKRKKYYWAAGNQAHRMTGDQYTRWVELKNEKKRKEYIEGLFPPVLSV